MRISVVIPAYNEEKYLPACLESLQAQTFRDFEVIVANNNSTDNTVGVAQKFGAHVTHESHKGVGAARKKGFSEAKGDIIVSTDADCTFPCDWLEKINIFFTQQDVKGEEGAIAVYGSLIFDDPFIIKKYLAFYLLKLFYRINDLLGKKMLAGANFAVRRRAYLQTSGIDAELDILEDADLSKKLMKVGKVTLDPSIIVSSSPRRFSNGNLAKNTWMYFKLYLQTWWKEEKKTESPLEDIR